MYKNTALPAEHSETEQVFSQILAGQKENESLLHKF